MENIDEIYKKYAKLIKNYIFSMTSNENLAEDIYARNIYSCYKRD